MELRVRTRIEGSQTLIEAAGEIDMHTAPQLREELIRAVGVATPSIVVDLAQVTFIDSTGIGVLVGGLKRAREKGGALAFCGAQTRVRRVFEITGLLHALPLFPNAQPALDFLRTLPAAPSGPSAPQEKGDAG